MDATTETCPPPALELERVEQRYPAGFLGRPRVVLHCVDLRIEPGERWAIVGPNGSGKSTLLRAAAGVEPPTAGHVRVYGDSLERSETRARIGYAPEGFPFPEDRRAAALLTLIGELAGLQRARARSRSLELLERVDLSPRVRLDRASRGMRQRFTVAQAFIAEPDLLLLDEPTLGLDADGLARLRDLLAASVENGAATLVASHLTGDLVANADRLAVIVDGRLQLAGRVSELADRGAHVSVELEGVDPDSWPALETAVAAAGGRIVERSPTNAALLELYATARK